jgi:hypothetical protein
MTFSLDLRSSPTTEEQAELVLLLKQSRDQIDALPDVMTSDGSNEQDDAMYESMAEISWAQRVSGRPIKSMKELRQSELDDVEFLLMVADQEGDEDQDIMDALTPQWEEDLDGTVFDPAAPFGHRACYAEFFQNKCSTTVRAVIDKGNFVLGSIAGQPPSVYIPKKLFEIGEEEMSEDILHSFYFMDLEFTPGMRNMWKATRIEPKLNTSLMHIEPSVASVHDYVLPTHPSYIGAIIGKGGKNINALINLRPRSCMFTQQYGYIPHCSPPNMEVLPEFTLTPTECGWNTRVRVEIPEGCDWGRFDIERVLMNMHT